MASASEACHKSSKLDKCEMLLSVGKNTNDFSRYDKWQRKEKTARPAELKDKTQETKVTFKVGKINQTIKAQSAPPVTRYKRIGGRAEEEKRKLRERIDTLKLKIKHSVQTTELCKKRSQELVEINLDIVSEIESHEHETYGEVKRLLRKYEKFRGSIASLNSHFSKEISEVRRELEETRSFIQKKIEALEHEVKEKDRALNILLGELEVLRSYKDKEYPVKAMMMAKLHAEIESIKNLNQEDREELEHIINAELGKYDKESIRLSNNITHRVTQESLALIHPSLEDMAIQNIIIKKEIEFHKITQKELIQRNIELKEEVTRLKKHPKSNLRLQLFPHLFPTDARCEPDIELVLDIPKQEWLPI